MVLEIGSGHNPKARSDILCDLAIDNDDQRGGGIVLDRPIVEADGQYLPFADSSFDYVICSHVLEHAEDPQLMMSELMRVAPRGYIETPSAIAEHLYGWPYHANLVTLVNGQLLLQKKAAKGKFGKLFHTLAARDKKFAGFNRSYQSLLIVQYEWTGKIDYCMLPADSLPLDLDCMEVVDRLLNHVREVPISARAISLLVRAIPRKLIFKAKSLVAKQRQPKKNLRDIVVCPICKGCVEWEADVIRCGRCNINYPIIRGIPRMLPAH